jgi:hypothetical protein
MDLPRALLPRAYLYFSNMNIRDILKRLDRDGWVVVRTRGVIIAR